MENPLKPPLQNPPIRDIENLCSATECTGLTPAAVYTQSEAEHYAHLYAIHRQQENTLATGQDADAADVQSRKEGRAVARSRMPFADGEE